MNNAVFGYCVTAYPTKHSTVLCECAVQNGGFNYCVNA